MKRRNLVIVAMALAILATLTLAGIDERREASQALAAFAREQSEIASATAALVKLLVERDRADPPRSARPDVLERLRARERPGEVLVLVKPPGAPLLATDGHAVTRPEIDAALARGDVWLSLARPEAASLGLPTRMAIAGLASFDAGGARWGVAVVKTAREERDRERGAEKRLALSVVVVTALVLVFGGVALRLQRKELALERDLLLAEARREGDDRLLRADKLASMGALASGIAHEVATPLGVIAGRAEQLAPRVEHDEKAKKAVAIIAEQCDRIGAIIKSFLTLARGGTSSFEHTDPAAVARRAVSLVEHRFADAAVTLAVDAEPALPAIACEPRLLEQAIVNLLLNACDASRRGGGVALAVRREGARVAFVVDDEGTGITGEAAARATEPFFTTKPEGKGTGLGLAIANEIVNHHAGSLVLSAREPRGTRARIDVPAAG